MMLPWQPILARQQDALGECNGKGEAEMSFRNKYTPGLQNKGGRRKKAGNGGLVSACPPAQILLLLFGSGRSVTKLGLSTGQLVGLRATPALSCKSCAKRNHHGNWEQW